MPQTNEMCRIAVDSHDGQSFFAQKLPESESSNRCPFTNLVPLNADWKLMTLRSSRDVVLRALS